MDNDLFICNCYIPPENSKILKGDVFEYFDILKSEIELYESMGNVIIIGDLNSRTGNLQESIDISHDHPERVTMDINTENYIIPRNNEDKTVNNFGKHLINMMNETHMLMLNGRTLGNFSGKKTCHKYNGSSTVDYIITSVSLSNSITSFKVWEPQWFTDHSPISCQIKLNHRLQNKMFDRNLIKCHKYIWNEDSKRKITKSLNDPITVKQFGEVSTLNNTNDCVDHIVKTLQKVADDNLTKIEISNNNPGKNTHQSKCKDKNMIETKREFKRAKRQYYQDQSNANKRILMISLKNKYKKIKYLLTKYSKEDKIRKLAFMENRQPQIFWKTVKSLMPKNKNKTNINSDNWLKYFTKLLNIKPPSKNSLESSFSTYVKESLPVIEKSMNEVGPLDDPITEDEVIWSLKSLKNNKATGKDGIKNEILKCESISLYKALTYTFNTILNNKNYPKQWLQNIITPIHKAGDSNDPNNYRGIAVSDSLNKVFTKIINDRLNAYLTEKEYWAPNQNGFMRNRRTDDNVFIIHTIFQKYVKLNKKKIYVTFVDFRKFFDSINRDCLFYKMIKSGITGKMYYVIKESYNNPMFCIRTDLGLTKDFISYTGLKQGCILSPLLSNIFQNDLHSIFTEDCKPVTLNNFSFNSLSWADDLVIFSTTKEGLQNSLDKLNNYCDKWHLSVNTNKTKCMLLSPGNSKMPNFSLNGDTLENVTTYKYLGVILHKNGKYNHAIKDRIIKSNRALHLLKQVLGYPNISVKMALSMFEKQIEPILLYGCPLWGLSDSNRYIYIKTDVIELRAKDQARKLLKDTLKREIEVDEVRAFREKKKILVKLHNLSDKIDILYRNGQNDQFLDHTINSEPCYETVHSKFCRYAIGARKFSSSTGIFSELDRYPIAIKAKSFSIAFWHRLETNDRIGVITQNAYMECKNNNHIFFQNTVHHLHKNGLGHVTDSPLLYNEKYFKKLVRLNMTDQYFQNQKDTILNDDRFNILKICDNRDMSSRNLYFKINDVNVRRCLVSLRLDKANLYKIEAKICDVCALEINTKHTLLYCKKIENIRNECFNNINNVFNGFRYLNEQDKIRYILNMDGNDNTTKMIYQFLKRIYKII